MVTELSPSTSKGTAMSAHTNTTAAGTQQVFSQHGRKGIAYDWQSLYAAAEAVDLDAKFAALAPALAE
jgi:hypothetical protein